MIAKDHANLLAIFFWIFSGIQILLVLFIGAYAGFIGFAAFSVGTGDGPNSAQGGMIFGILFVLILVLLFFGIAGVVLNIIAGYGLRKEKLWARRWGIVASIVSILSFMCGGIILLPFGVALGSYGLWFFFGEQGRSFPQTGMITGSKPPPPPVSF